MVSFDQFVKHLIAQATGDNGTGQSGNLPAGTVYGPPVPPPLAPVTPSYNNPRVNPFGGFTPMSAPEAAVQQQVSGQAGPSMPPELAALVQMAAAEQARDDAGLPGPPSPVEQAAQQVQQVVGAPPTVTGIPDISPTDVVNAVTPDVINRGNIGNLIPNQLTPQIGLDVASQIPGIGQAIGVGRELAAIPNLTAEAVRQPRDTIADLTGRYATQAMQSVNPGLAITSLLERNKKVRSVSDILLGEPLTNRLEDPSTIPSALAGAIEPTHPLSTGENILGGIASIPVYARPAHEVLDRVGDLQHAVLTGNWDENTLLGSGKWSVSELDLLRPVLALMPGGQLLKQGGQALTGASWLSKQVQDSSGVDLNAPDALDGARVGAVEKMLQAGIPPAVMLDVVVGGDEAVKAAQATTGGNDTYNAVHAVARNKLPWGLDFGYDVLTGVGWDPWSITMIGPGIMGSFGTAAKATEEASVARQFFQSLDETRRAEALGGKTVEEVIADPEARAVAAGHGDAAGFVPDAEAVATAGRYQAAAKLVKALIHVAEAPETAIFKPVGAALKGLTYPIRGAFAPNARRVAREAMERRVEGFGQYQNRLERQAQAAQAAATGPQPPLGPFPAELGPEIPPDLLAPGAPQPETLIPRPEEGPLPGDLLQGPRPAEVFPGPMPQDLLPQPAPTNGAAPAAEAQQAVIADVVDRLLPTPEQLNGLPEDPVAAAAAAAEAAKPPITLSPDDTDLLLGLRQTRDAAVADLERVPTSVGYRQQLAITQNKIYRLLTEAEGSRQDLYDEPLRVTNPERGRLPIEDRVDGGAGPEAAAPTTTEVLAPPAEAAPLPGPSTTELLHGPRPEEVAPVDIAQLETERAAAEQRLVRETRNVERMEGRDPTARKPLSDARARARALRTEITDLGTRIDAVRGDILGPSAADMLPGPRPDEVLIGPRPGEVGPEIPPDLLTPGAPRPETLQPLPPEFGPPQPQVGPELPTGPDVGPTEDLGDLGPQPGKHRIPEQVAAHGRQYPAAAKAFWDAYSPLAKARRAQQAATDLRLRGTPELRTARAVEAAEHMVQDIQPLFREHVGREPEVVFNKGKGAVAKRTTPQLLDRMLHDADPLKRADAYRVLTWLSQHGRSELAPYMDRIRALREQNEAERFASADAARTGPRHDPLGTNAQRRYNPWPTEPDPIAEAFQEGDLSPENYHAMIEPVEVTYTNAKGKTATIELRAIDAYTRNLQTMGPQEALRTTIKQIQDAIPVPADKARARRFIRPLKAFDKLQTFTRNKQMHSWITAPRGFLFDWAGDSLAMIANGEGHAVWRAGLPGGKLFRRALKDVQRETADGIAGADPGQLASNLGIDSSTTRYGQGMTAGISPENIGPDGRVRLPAEHWVLEKTGSRGLSKATGALVGSQSAANLRTAGDLVRRAAFWTTVILRQLPAQRQAYFRDLARTAAGNGLDAATVRKITTSLGEQFAPADVRRLSQEAGLSDGVANRLANDWQHRVTAMDKAARARVSEILPDFGKTTKADEVMRRFFMYHFWLTRASPIYLRTVLRNPALLREFNNYATEMRQQCEGRGGQMCGWARIFTEHGFGLWGNPGAIASTMFLDTDPERGLGQDATTYDKLKAKIPLMTTPVVDATMGYLGLSSRAPDLLAMAGDSNAVTAGVNALRARDLLPGGNAPVANPYLQVITSAGRIASGIFGDDEGILRQQPDISQTANDTSNIQWRAQELVAKKYNLSATLDTSLWTKAAVTDLVNAKNSIIAGTYDDPIAKQALKDWTAGNLTHQALKYTLMGGVPIRSQYKLDERTAAAYPTQGEELARGPRRLGQGPVPGGLVPTDSVARRAAEGAQSQLTAGDMGSMADLELWQADQAKKALLVDPTTGGSSPAGQADALYTAIVYGDQPPDVVISGQTIPGSEIAQLPKFASDMTEDDLLAGTTVTRDDIAQRALVEAGLFDEWQTLSATEDHLAADPTNWRYQQLADYRSGVRKMGVPAFIDAATKGNPSFAYWYDHLSDATKADPARLEAATMGIDAFLALQGDKSSAWTPDLNVRAPEDIPYNPAAETGGGGAGGSGFTPKSRGQMVLEDTAKYNQQVAMVKPILFQLTGDPNFDLANTNPQLQTALMNELQMMGVSIPSKPKSVQRYETWKGTQPAGADTSLLAYTQFGEAFDAATAGSGMDFDMAMDLLGAQGIPGFSALGALGLDGASPGGLPVGSAPSVLDVMNGGGGNYTPSVNDILSRRRGYTQTTSDILGGGRYAQTVNDLLRSR